MSMQPANSVAEMTLTSVMSESPKYVTSIFYFPDGGQCMSSANPTQKKHCAYKRERRPKKCQARSACSARGSIERQSMGHQCITTGEDLDFGALKEVEKNTVEKDPKQSLPTSISSLATSYHSERVIGFYRVWTIANPWLVHLEVLILFMQFEEARRKERYLGCGTGRLTGILLLCRCSEPLIHHLLPLIH